MPQVKQEDGTYREIAFAINAKTRKMIEEAVIDEYEKFAAYMPEQGAEEETKCHPSKRKGKLSPHESCQSELGFDPQKQKELRLFEFRRKTIDESPLPTANHPHCSSGPTNTQRVQRLK